MLLQLILDMSTTQKNVKKRKHSIISDYDDPAGVLAQLKKTVAVKQKARDKVFFLSPRFIGRNFNLFSRFSVF
jgi:hypothetical protein